MRTKPREKDHGVSLLKNAFYAFRLVSKVAPANIPLCAVSLTAYYFFSNYILPVLFLKKLLEVLTRNGTFQEFMSVLLLFCVGAVGAKCADNFGDYVYSVGDKSVYKGLNEMLFRKASVVDIECFENPAFYDVYKRASEVITDAHYSTYCWQIASLVAEIFTGGFLLFYVSGVDPKILVILLLCVVSFAVDFKTRGLYFTRDNAMTGNRRKKAYVQRVIFLRDYAKDIRTSGIFHVMDKRLTEATEDNCAIIGKYGKKTALLCVISQLLGTALPIAGTFSYAAYRFLVDKELDVSDFSVLMTAVTSIKSIVMSIGNTISYIQQTTLYFGNFRKFMEYKPQIQDGDKPLDAIRTIEFQNVTFTYPGAKKPSLKNISLKIGEGETVAIVGKNGAGKSTFVKLLLRFYDPDEGRILFNGVDIRSFRLEDLRLRIGTVFQDYKIFALTVNENVLCRECKTDEDRRQAETAMKNSGVYPKIQTLPHGADSILTREFDDEGAGLSGGEQQKIAAARMFARSFDTAVLDEPSSALDPIAEYQMYESLIKATEDKTVIFISHRLSSATLSDSVFVFDNAELIESGSHDELMKRDGFYATMFRMQASNYQ